MSASERWGTPWGQCYAYFGLDESQFDEEIGCLRLAFYLAHFGMFRASGKTRDLQLRDYKKLVRDCRNHGNLRDKGPKFFAENQNNVEEFIQTLTATLKAVGVSPTDTLLSKIALGTTACLPAYDPYAKIALRANGIPGVLSKRGLHKLYELREESLGLFGATLSDGIPFMRCLDIGLLKTGQGFGHARPLFKKKVRKPPTV